MSTTSDILIVGGGIIGSTIAWRLAQAGAGVRVLERSTPGSEASSAAAGILAPQAEAAGPGPFLSLGLQSREMHASLAAELRDTVGVDVDFGRCGALELASGEPELAELSRRLSWQAEAGLAIERLTLADIAKLEPGLGRGWAGGFFLPQEGRVEARLLVRGITQAAGRAGVVFERAPVQRIELRGGSATGATLGDGGVRRAGTVILAAGAWSSGLLAAEDLGVEPVRGQMIEIQAAPGLLRRVTFALGGYLVPRSDGRITVGSTTERVGFDKRTTVGGLDTLINRARQAIPALAGAPVLASWAGLRPGTPSGLPILGPHPTIPGLILATGHHRNGILLAPATARLIADAALGRGDPSHWSPFALRRGGARDQAPAVLC